MSPVHYIEVWPTNKQEPAKAWGWPVSFDDGGLDQFGEADSLNAALEHVKGALENADADASS